MVGWFGCQGSFGSPAQLHWGAWGSMTHRLQIKLGTTNATSYIPVAHSFIELLAPSGGLLRQNGQPIKACIG